MWVEKRKAVTETWKRQNARKFASKKWIQRVDLAAATHKAIEDENVENKHGIPKENCCVCVLSLTENVCSSSSTSKGPTTADGFMWLVFLPNDWCSPLS